MIDINSASIIELMNLKGLSEEQIDMIIHGRPFVSIEELCELLGVDEKFIKQLKAQGVIVKKVAAGPRPIASVLSQGSDKSTLSISKRGNEYEVSFKPSEAHGDAAELCEFIKVSPDSRSDLVNRINDLVTLLNVFSGTHGSTQDTQDAQNVQEAKDNSQMSPVVRDKIQELSSLGQLMFSMFLPATIQNHLQNINTPLILKTNDNEIPWELLHDTTNFLCLKVPLGRTLRTREIPRTNQVSSSDIIRFLFITNPTGDLGEAEEEVKYIINHLDKNIVIDILACQQASNASILSALKSGKYHVIHYSGHAEFNSESPDESAIICANKNKIYAQEIKRILGGKPLVFLNACGSGLEKIYEDNRSCTGSDTEGLASSFIIGGALSFIGSSWPVLDISAGIFASEFYKQLLAGDSTGAALNKARKHLKSTRGDDINWMAFILYGDPTLKLGN